MRGLMHLCGSASKHWTIMPAIVVLSMLFTAPCSLIAGERDDVPSILDRVRTRLTATTERLKRFGVDPKMLVDGAVTCGTGGAAGCTGYAAAQYINNIGPEYDRLGAEAAAISTTDPTARAKLDRIQGRLSVLDRRVNQIETVTVYARDTSIGCLSKAYAGGPVGCAVGAAESAGWLLAEKYAPPGYAKQIRAAKLVTGLAGGAWTGGRGFPLPSGETVRGLEGATLGLSKSAAIEAINKATQEDAPKLIQAIQAQFARPGGISLSKAAAERLALNIDIDSLAYRDGQVVLSGAQNNATKIDAALFLTALRLACGWYDPFFSLDPVDGAAWSDQGREALGLVWDRIKDSYSQDSGANGFTIETFSVKRRYPSLWAELEPRYPELRSRLVFRPAELKETRFGEILYKADVLLKELASGVSVLEPGAPLRASAIPGYIPSDQRSAARSPLIAKRSKEFRGWRGHRLWFDLLPQASPAEPVPYQNPDSELDRSNPRGLYSILHARGFLGGAPNGLQKTAFSVSDGVVDVSDVYPKMFVRRHDHATGQDINGADPDLDLLSSNVNARTALYVNAYQELRDLTDVFRAYVASVKIAQQNVGICMAVQRLPLSEGEKVTIPLPEFHPSELFITVAKYAWTVGGGRRSLLWGGNSINGGIALRGKEFAAVAAVQQETPIIKQVKQTLAMGVPKQRWDDSSGRQYLAFAVDPREPPRRAPIVAAGSSQ